MKHPSLNTRLAASPDTVHSFGAYHLREEIHQPGQLPPIPLSFQGIKNTRSFLDIPQIHHVSGVREGHFAS